jgi:hypothetical protein
LDLKEALTAVALIGTGGALGSWLSVWLRNRREDRLRWHNELRAASERFLTATDKTHDTEMLIAQHVGNLRQLTDWGDDPLFDEEHLLRHAEKRPDDTTSYSIETVRRYRTIANEAQDQMYGAMAALEMISVPGVVNAALDYLNVTKSFVSVAFAYPPQECGGWSPPLVEASDKVTAARAAFLAAVRHALGVQT